MGSGEQTFSDSYQPMKDRISLVTGGSRGIGAATAFLLGQYGARMAVNYYRNEAAAQAIVSTNEKAGGKACAFQADVANAEQVEAMVQAVGETLSPIDTLIPNAPAFSSSSGGKEPLREWGSLSLHRKTHAGGPCPMGQGLNKAPM